MAANVGKYRNQGLVADTVHAEMRRFKDDCFLVRVIAGFRQPFHFASIVHIDRIQIAALLSLCRRVRNGNADSLSIQAAQLGFLAVLDFPKGNIINGAISDSRLCLGRRNRGFLHLENDVAAGLTVQFFKGIQGETEVGHRIGVDGKVLNLGGHQLIQCVCFQDDLHIFPCVTHIYRNHHSNTVCGVAILFRISNCLVDCLLHRASVDVGISVGSGFHRCGLTGGRGVGVVLVRAVDDGGILLIFGRGAAGGGTSTSAAARFLLRCQRNNRLSLIVFHICVLDCFDLELTCAGYCNSAVCIHCCRTTDY